VRADEHLAPGAHKAVAQLAGYATAQAQFSVDATSVVIDFALAVATATIEGRVTALDSGAALSDGQVIVRDSLGALVTSAVPDATGFYAAAGSRRAAIRSTLNSTATSSAAGACRSA
jgi:hypothetical protein